MTIRGTAPDQLVTLRREWPVPVRRPSTGAGTGHAARRDPREGPTAREETLEALVGLGFERAISRAAVDEAAAHVAHDASIQDWLRAALQRCPRPRA